MIVPWLKKTWEKTVNTLHQGTLPHALLISGTAGLGKFEFTVEFAKKILCAKKETQACEHCHSCQWFAANSHPDYWLIEPEEDKKQISIAQIRDLTEALGKTGYGHYQVVIIHPAEAMNRAAANALLKTLEEPSGQVVILLVCDRPAGLLPTIRSRCQEIRVQPPSDENALEWLTSKLKSATPQPSELMALADGLPVLALHLAESGEWEQNDQISEDFLGVLTGKLSVLKAAEKWAKQSVEQVLTILSTFIQDLIRLNFGLSASQLQHSHRAQEMQRILPFFSLQQLWSFLTEIHTAKRRILSTANPNAQLLLESFLLSLHLDQRRK